MSVYKKLQAARVLLSKKELKKSGQNKHLGFGYFELQDFLPQTMEIFDSLGLCGITDFSEERLVKLLIIDTESETSTVFSVEKAEPGLRNGTPIQNIGAQQTYLRRYLWVQAMELTENDAIDSLGHEEKLTVADQNRQKAIPKEKQEAINYKEILRSSTSLTDLSAKWAGTPNKYKTGDLIAEKERLKDKLMTIEQKIRNCKNMDELTALCDRLTNEENDDNSDIISEMLDYFRGQDVTSN